MPDQNHALEERVQLLRQQLLHMEQVLAQVRHQVAAVQAELEAARPQAATTVESKSAQQEFAPAAPPPAPEPVAAQARVPHRDWEALIGGNWFNKIGIGAIILGMAFFLRYAIEIGNLGKVLLGMAVGLLFLAGGEKYHRRQLKIFARGLTGGGAAILYLSLYFALQIYQILPQSAAFILMTRTHPHTVGWS